MYDPDDIFADDADIEMQQLKQAGNLIARLKKKGICLHGHTNTKSLECYGCKKTWETLEEMMKEINDLSLEYGI